MNSRWLRLSWSVITMICLGLLYAWSVFVTPLEGEFGWTRSDTSMTFTVCMAAFTIGCIFTGVLIKKLPAKVIMVIGATCILIGLLLASRIVSLAGLYVCYGVLCGFGVGIEYNSLLNMILKWFPDKIGIVSGILLMGFGMGGSVFGTIAVKLMMIFGWRVTFCILGAILAVVIIFTSILLRQPSMKEYTDLMFANVAKEQSSKQYTTKEMIKTSSFYGVFVWVAVASAVGTAILSNASPMALSMTDNVMMATSVAGCVSIFNGIGRFVFGFILDAVGSKRTLLLISSGLVLASIVLTGAFVSGQFAVLTIGFVMLGISFGGVTPFLSTYTTKIYGQDNYAKNFSLINICLMGGAFLGPYIAGKAGTAGQYQSATIVFVLFGASCIVIAKNIKLHFSGKKRIH